MWGLTAVTSHVEVWIETQEAGQRLKNKYVTSHVEVWIETARRSYLFLSRLVTSHVEVWIETSAQSLGYNVKESPPTWRCGLKRSMHVHTNRHVVTSHVEVWIETVNRKEVVSVQLVTSHVEVWIETPPLYVTMIYGSHLPRGGVD